MYRGISGHTLKFKEKFVYAEQDGYQNVKRPNVTLNLSLLVEFLTLNK